MANQYRKRATQPQPTKVDAGSLADALIAKAQQQGESLPEFLKSELAKLLAYNDQAPRSHRVTSEAAMQLLRTNGHPMGRGLFEKTIRREFGRSWGSK